MKNFNKHALKISLLNSESKNTFKEFIEYIKNGIPDNFILESNYLIIVKMNDEIDQKTIDNATILSEINTNHVKIEELELDKFNKTPEFWDNIEKMSAITLAAKTLVDASKLNGVSPDELIEIVVSLAKKEWNNKNKPFQGY